MKSWKVIADPTLALLSLIAMICGLFIIYDAGYARAIRSGQSPLSREFIVQSLATVAAVVLMVGIARIPIGKFSKFGGKIIAATIVLLFMVELPVIGTTMNGANRWVNFGFINIQPSEFAKIGVILYLASLFSQREVWKEPTRKIRTWYENLDYRLIPKFKRAIPAMVIALVAIKIEQEPDLGTAAVVMVVAFALFYLGGVSKKSLMWLVAIGVVGCGLLAVAQPYRLERITNHGDRWSDRHVDDIGFQTTHSESAQASGGIIGAGMGTGRAKHILPAATTDFVMATIGEEFGFVGSLATLGLLGAITWRLMHLSRLAISRYASLVLAGVGCWIGIQASVNVMMANGFLPPIGIPLPFFSSGGSSLLAMGIALGLCQSAANSIPKGWGNIDASDHNGRRDGGTRLPGARSSSGL